MMQFWLIASILVIAASALVVIPLLMNSRRTTATSLETANVVYYQDQLEDIRLQEQRGDIDATEAAQLCLELDKVLVDSAGTSVVSDSGPGKKNSTAELAAKLPFALVFALLIPLVAVPLYFQLGAQVEMEIAEAFTNPGLSKEELLPILEYWNEKRAGNPQALKLLANHYLGSGRMVQAVAIYRELYALVGESSEASALLAQALFLAAGNQMTDEVRKLYREAIAVNPGNNMALGLQGIDAYMQSRFDEAVRAWSRALETESDPTSRQFLVSGISKARAQLGNLGPELRVYVSLAPELQSLPGNTRVLIFARSSGGPRAPLAVVPVLVSELPRVVVLDDSSSMMIGGGKLSDAERLDVVARISLDGDVRKAGYQAEVKSISLDSNELIQLMISPPG